MPDIFDASVHQPTDDSTKEPTVPKSEKSTDSKSEFGMSQSESSPKRSKKIKNVDEYSETMRNEKYSNNFFRSFLAKPENVFFASQHKDEKVLLLLRKHPITQVPWIAISIALLFLPNIFFSIGLLSFLPANFQFAAGLGWYLLVMGYVIESYLTWFYNVYIITDERVIDVDFINLLNKNISAAKIDTIQDITSVMLGISSSIFNYGTVKIQTAAAVVEFDFEDVPQPAKVIAFLNEMLL